MAVSPGVYNINLQRRADYSLGLQFNDSSNTAINLTGWTIYAQVWDRARTVKYANFAVEYNNRSTGQATISLTDTQTSSFPQECYFDVLLENPSGLKEYYLEGVIYVSQGYTEPGL